MSLLSIILLLFAILLVASVLFIYSGPKLTEVDKQVLKEVMSSPIPNQYYGKPGITKNGEVLIYYEFIEAAQNRQNSTILLVNGLGHSMLNWPRYMIEELSHQGYDIIRFDNRDVGMSDWIKDWGKGKYYKLSDMANDAIAVLDQLNIDQVQVIGVSMGGMIAQQLAIDHPQRILSLCSVMSSGHFYDPTTPNDPPAFRNGVLKSLLRYTTFFPSEVNHCKLQMTIWKLLHGAADYPINQKEICQRTLFELRERRGFNKRSTRQQGVAIAKSGSRYESLARLTLPTLIIHGTTDPLVTIDHAHAYAKYLPHAQVVFLEGMGHDLPEAYQDDIMQNIREHLSTVNQINLTT